MKKPNVKVAPGSRVPSALTYLSGIYKKEDGRISWPSSKLDDGTFALLANINIQPRVDDYIKDMSIWKSLSECAKQDNFTTANFIRLFREQIIEHLSKRKSRYSFITQINCNTIDRLPASIPSLHARVVFATTLTRREGRVFGHLDEHDRARFSFAQDFIFAKSKLKVVDDRKALDLGIENIQFCLGLLNLYIGGYGVTIRSGHPDAPIGRVLLSAPGMILKNGNTQLGSYYHEDYFPTKYKRSFTVWADKFDGADKLLESFLRRIRLVDFGDKAIRAILLFQEGLSTNDVDAALLKFWIGIEILCSSNARETSEHVIHRASSVFQHPELAAMRLKYLQEFRNGLIHHAQTGAHALMCAQWGSIYLAQLIRFFLFNGYGIRAHREMLAFLSIKLEQEHVLRTIRLHKQRLKAIRTKRALFDDSKG